VRRKIFSTRYVDDTVVYKPILPLLVMCKTGKVKRITGRNRCRSFR